MAKHIERTYEQGKHVCEWVDEVPPLGEDRKTIIVPPPPMEELISQIADQISDKKLVSQLEDSIAELQGSLFTLPSLIMSAITTDCGDEADRVWETIEKTMYDFGSQRAKEIADVMKIDPRDARSVGRVFDLEDAQMGVKGEWVETGKKRAVKHEYYCPFANAASLCPEICTRLIDAVERGTLDAMGVKGKFSLGKLLSKGDPYCEVILELED